MNVNMKKYQQVPVLILILRNFLGFPPGVTVDELNQYRRKRRPQNQVRPADNLHLLEGSQKTIKTEYTRRYQPHKSEDLNNSLKQLTTSRIKQSDQVMLGEEYNSLDQGEYSRRYQPHKSEDLNSNLRQITASRIKQSDQVMLGEEYNSQNQGEYKENFRDFPRSRPKVQKPSSNLESDKTPVEFNTENLEKFKIFSNFGRSKSLRRKTALKLEGEIDCETVMKKEFQPFERSQRVSAFKRPNNIQIEGLFETLTSEQKEKYVTYLISRREGLVARESQLKLDGDFQFSTENADKFIYKGPQARPLLRKRSTSLKLEGETEFLPEYSQSFIQCPISRACLIKPREQLRLEGEFELSTESQTKYIVPGVQETPRSAKKLSHLHLEGDQNFYPEYREMFINHGRSKSEIIRKKDNLNLEGHLSYETENIKYSPNFSNNEKPAKNNTLSNTEYHSKFLDFPRNRPQMQRPSSNLQNNGPYDMNTEKRLQYRNYGTMPRMTPRKRQPNLELSGGIDGAPEYKDQFIEFPLSYKKVPKPSDSLSRKEYPSFQVSLFLRYLTQEID